MVEIPHGCPARWSHFRFSLPISHRSPSLNSSLVNCKKKIIVHSFLDIKVADDASEKISSKMHSPHISKCWLMCLIETKFCTLFAALHSASFKFYDCFTEEKKDWRGFRFVVKLNARVTGLIQSASLMCKWKWTENDLVLNSGWEQLTGLLCTWNLSQWNHPFFD